jgi:hypothetical protein
MPEVLEKIVKAVLGNLEGKKVTSKWAYKYGKRYSKKEATQAGYAIANARFKFKEKS